MKKMKKTGILQLVMPGEEVSGKSVNPKELLSKRKRNTGTMPDQQEVKAQDKLLFRIYLNQKFRNAVSPGKDGALDYELEYLLGGKKSDEANLKSAVRQLLLIREGMNYLTLMKDAKRQAEAAELAIAISTAFLSPEFEEVVRQAILVAWAFQESVRDVKDLLADKKVPLVKTVDQWGRSVNKGLSYQHYLQMLLMLRKDSDLAYRAMDLIEKKEQVQMDTMVSRMDCTYEYQADGLFSGFVWIGSTGDGYYRFQETQSLSYLG
jgi:hypothetical protein